MMCQHFITSYLFWYANGLY